MKHPMVLSLLVTLLLSTAARSQQPSSAYDFRVVAQPGMTIDGHHFTPDTVIGSVALNDKGDCAFIAQWKDPTGYVRGSVFTPTRFVADEAEVFPGLYTESIPSDGHLAINAAGQVAFELIYSEAGSNPQNWDGIFVEGQLALRRSLDAEGSPFTLTDDGQVIPGPQKAGAAPAPPTPATSQGKPSLLDQLHMKQPKFPFGITVSPKSPTANQPRPTSGQSAVRPPLTSTASPFADMRTNRRGQVLIPLNFGTGGFIVVLGTPIANAPHAR
jgi:hypothetical protein